MSTTLSPELQSKIDNIKTKQAKMAGILTNSKDGVKIALIEAIMKAMTDQDFEDNSDYQKANEESKNDEDNTVKKGILPKTGKSMHLNIIIVCIGIAILSICIILQKETKKLH